MPPPHEGLDLVSGSLQLVTQLLALAEEIVALRNQRGGRGDVAAAG
ncbi:hypothetical protein [Bradyrhizobium sp. 5.13L]